jgi:hypothetical protein
VLYIGDLVGQLATDERLVAAYGGVESPSRRQVVAAVYGHVPPYWRRLTSSRIAGYLAMQ